MVETFGTSEIDPVKLGDLVQDHFDLRPAAIIERLNLRRPIFRRTAAYGHFGRPSRTSPGSRPNEADALPQGGRVAGREPRADRPCDRAGLPRPARRPRGRPRLRLPRARRARRRRSRVGTIVRVPLHGRRVRGLGRRRRRRARGRPRADLLPLRAGRVGGPAGRRRRPVPTGRRGAGPGPVAALLRRRRRRTRSLPRRRRSRRCACTRRRRCPRCVAEARAASRAVRRLAARRPTRELVLGLLAAGGLDDRRSLPGAARVAAARAAQLEREGRTPVTLRSDQPAAERTAMWDAARAGAASSSAGGWPCSRPCPTCRASSCSTTATRR